MCFVGRWICSRHQKPLDTIGGAERMVCLTMVLRAKSTPTARRAIVYLTNAAMKQTSQGDRPALSEVEITVSWGQFRTLVGDWIDENREALEGGGQGDLRHLFDCLRRAVAINVILAPEETSLGYVEGRLEAINLHDDANVFYIYPIVGPTKIRCGFPSELRDEAVRALDHEVRVQGTLCYKSRASFPYRIDAEALTVIPDESELPSLMDLRGIAPNATDGLPSEEFVRRVRDEWQ